MVDSVRGEAGSTRERAPARVVIEDVQPAVDGGRFPIKRTIGEEVVVTADIFAEGHDVLAAVILHRPAGATEWNETAMTHRGNDAWTGRFQVSSQGWHEYTVMAWVDTFASWHHELTKKSQAGQDVASELLEGAELIKAAAHRATGPEADRLRNRAGMIGRGSDPTPRIYAALDPELAQLMARHPDRSGARTYDRVLRIMVERERARFGAWYEMFPRSCAAEPGRHGTFKDAEARLDYVASMGFNVLYLPPIHPIGRSFRKGPNNTLTAGPGDPGSPWAIGAGEGGHKAILKELGTLDDFDSLVSAANRRDIEIALDIALQCSPDHPYVRENPQWFRHRPDGTIKYAENPPKKYQDIYPINFECADWKNLWNEVKSIFDFWIGHGVKIFRVDNPHTKPYRFWEWLIGAVWNEHPDVVFLAEAFTRPKVMRHLAKLGYSQSYSYFTWRNTKSALTEYFTELTSTEVAEYMRPNLFANTPDILHEYLQTGGRPAFQIRLVLAATLGASYGIYGPPFEQCVGTPWRQGSEEYLDSEKYQVRHWDLDRPGTLRDFIARINTIRRENAALHHDRNLRFVPIDNDRMIAYSKAMPDRSNTLIIIVNLDPYHTQSGWVHLPIAPLGLGSGPGQAYQVHDLISEARYLWHGESNYVQLDPFACPAHILRVRRKIKTEQDFDYYM
jgi:starch synthase (maltosyl-transferring)